MQRISTYFLCPQNTALNKDKILIIKTNMHKQQGDNNDSWVNENLEILNLKNAGNNLHHLLCSI